MSVYHLHQIFVYTRDSSTRWPAVSPDRSSRLSAAPPRNSELAASEDQFDQFLYYVSGDSTKWRDVTWRDQILYYVSGDSTKWRDVTWCDLTNFSTTWVSMSHEEVYVATPQSHHMATTPAVDTAPELVLEVRQVLFVCFHCARGETSFVCLFSLGQVLFVCFHC